MCGIAGIILKPGAPMDWRALERFADALLLGIDNRGGHATGYVARSASGEVRLQRAACAARLFIDERRPFPVGTTSVLLHTRFATQGDPAFPENNHPVYAGDIYCTHNGHVSNDAELIREAGSVRLGRVDSEAIPAIVNHFGWDLAGEAMEQVEGAAAVGLMHAATGDVILARAYQSPLVFVDHPSMLVWASTRYAIETAWREVIGTPPKAKRFHTCKEGELVRVSPQGEKRTELFKVAVPAWSMDRYYYSAPAAGKIEGLRKRLGVITGGATGSEGACGVDWWEDESEVVTGAQAAPQTFEACDCCGDYFAPGELWEVWQNFDVCSACERWFTDEETPVRGPAATKWIRQVEA